jgi:hypothetical protein
MDNIDANAILEMEKHEASKKEGLQVHNSTP